MNEETAATFESEPDESDTVQPRHILQHDGEGDGWKEPLSETWRCSCGEELATWVQTEPDCLDRPYEEDIYRLHAIHVEENLTGDGDLLLLPEDLDSLQRSVEAEITGTGTMWFNPAVDTDELRSLQSLRAEKIIELVTMTVWRRHFFNDSDSFYCDVYIHGFNDALKIAIDKVKLGASEQGKDEETAETLRLLARTLELTRKRVPEDFHWQRPEDDDPETTFEAYWRGRADAGDDVERTASLGTPATSPARLTLPTIEAIDAARGQRPRDLFFRDTTECINSEPIPQPTGQRMNITITGASDDLVEIGGDVSLESTALYNDPTIVKLNGIEAVAVNYGNEGTWNVVKLATFPVELEAVFTPAIDEDTRTHPGTTLCGYSDILEITGVITRIECEDELWEAN